MNKQKVPKLRFPGFSGEWQEKRLGDICALSKKKINPLTEAINYKCLELEHFEQETGRIIGYTDSQLQKSIKNKFDPGDVLYGKLRPYLKKFYKADFEGVCSSEIFVLQGKKVSNDYLYYLIQTDNFNQIANMSTGSKMPRSDWHSMAIVGFNIPTPPEQKKIAEFLSDIDTKIEKLTRKKELTEQYKKGAMQKTFSQKIRFKDEKGKIYPDWEEKRLGDVCSFTNGKAHEGVISDTGKYIVVNSKFISTNGEIKKFSNSQISPLYQDDLVMVMSDIPKGKALAKCFFIEKDNIYTLNQRICSLKSDMASTKFLYYLVNRHDYFLAFDSGVGQTNLRKDEVLECPLYMPVEKEEQKKIAEFLTNFDKKIEQIDTELNAVKEFKKGLLQGMFV